MMTKVMYYGSLVTLGLAMVLMLHLSYVLFFPFEVFNVKHSPLPILNEDKIVKEGQNIVYKLEYCKYMDLQAEISYQLVDGVIISLPAKKSTLPSGCRTVNLSSVTVPYGVHSTKHKYKLVMNISYKIHPLRTVTYHVETEEFTIKR